MNRDLVFRIITKGELVVLVTFDPDGKLQVLGEEVELSPELREKVREALKYADSGSGR